MTQENVWPPESPQVVGLFLQVSLSNPNVCLLLKQKYPKIILESFYKASACLINDQKRIQIIQAFCE